MLTELETIGEWLSPEEYEKAYRFNERLKKAKDENTTQEMACTNEEGLRVKVSIRPDDEVTDIAEMAIDVTSALSGCPAKFRTVHSLGMENDMDWKERLAGIDEIIFDTFCEIHPFRITDESKKELYATINEFLIEIHTRQTVRDTVEKIYYAHMSADAYEFEYLDKIGGRNK